jgi:hypothetical protein
MERATEQPAPVATPVLTSDASKNADDHDAATPEIGHAQSAEVLPGVSQSQPFKAGAASVPPEQ